jgi:hypothetical protein
MRRAPARWRGAGRLALPVIAPPLPDGGHSAKGAGLVVVRALAHDRDVCHALESDEWEIRQVAVMDLIENLLPLSSV